MVLCCSAVRASLYVCVESGVLLPSLVGDVAIGTLALAGGGCGEAGNDVTCIEPVSGWCNVVLWQSTIVCAPVS